MPTDRSYFLCDKIEQFPEIIVSIIVPTFNSAVYLKKALDSIMMQTYQSWEAIIIDNYSSDNTDQILSSFTDMRFSKFKVNNGGSIALSRNKGIRSARGEWIAFLDSDDEWDPFKLEKISKYFIDDVDFIYHDMKIIHHELSSEKIYHFKSRQVRKPVLMDLLVNGNTISTSSVVTRKSIFSKIGEMNESLSLAGTSDFNTWLKIARLTDNFKYHSEFLGSYRRHSQNTSETIPKTLPWSAMEEFLQEISNSQRRLITNNYIYSVGRLNYLNRDYREACDHLALIIKNGTIIQKVKSIFMVFSIRISMMFGKS